MFNSTICLNSNLSNSFSLGHFSKTILKNLSEPACIVTPIVLPSTERYALASVLFWLLFLNAASHTYRPTSTEVGLLMTSLRPNESTPAVSLTPLRFQNTCSLSRDLLHRHTKHSTLTAMLTLILKPWNMKSTATSYVLNIQENYIQYMVKSMWAPWITRFTRPQIQAETNCNV